MSNTPIWDLGSKLREKQSVKVDDFPDKKKEDKWKRDEALLVKKELGKIAPKAQKRFWKKLDDDETAREAIEEVLKGE